MAIASTIIFWASNTLTIISAVLCNKQFFLLLLFVVRLSVNFLIAQRRSVQLTGTDERGKKSIGVINKCPWSCHGDNGKSLPFSPPATNFARRRKLCNVKFMALKFVDDGAGVCG